MRLYNTLTRNVDDIKPAKSPKISVYTCGPTVYDYSHVGHWFTYVRSDTLVRVLQMAGFEPKTVMNITDVGHLVSDADDGEDKLEKGARREGKTAWEVAEFYTNDFLEGVKQLNITMPKFLTKATDHISEQIELIQKLESKDYTYTIDDGVYYDTSKFPTYADFARLDTKDQQAGARVAFNPQKRNSTDFALWKFSPEAQKRDMEWDSPWGKGFPGWHIECSAMSMKYLGETIDIHTGGIDHIPIHHTNEIAQSEAATGKQFVRYWMHSNHVLVDGQKISKSLGNGIRLSEVVSHDYSPMVLRLNILESHYRTQSKFSWDSLEAAQTRLKNYYNMAVHRFQANNTGISKKEIESFTKKFTTALLDDLNTPLALSELSSFQGIVSEQGVAKADMKPFTDALDMIDAALGIDLMKRSDISKEHQSLLAERRIARDTQDWKLSDQLRDELHTHGVGVQDTEQRQVWYWL